MSLVPYVVEQTSRGERSYDIFSRLLNDRIVFWPKAYNLSQYRTDLAILKFAHSHLPFGFGRL